MSLKDTLAKLTKQDKLNILQQIVILPAIEEDGFLSEEERGDILIAGQRLGFTKEEIEAEIEVQLNEEGASAERG